MFFSSLHDFLAIYCSVWLLYVHKQTCLNFPLFGGCFILVIHRWLLQLLQWNAFFSCVRFALIGDNLGRFVFSWFYWNFLWGCLQLRFCMLRLWLLLFLLHLAKYDENCISCLHFKLSKKTSFTSDWSAWASSSSNSPCSSLKSGNAISLPFSVGNAISGNSIFLLLLIIRSLIRLTMSSRFLVTINVSNQFICVLIGNR